MSILAAVVFSTPTTAFEAIEVRVNGEPVAFHGAAPLVKGNRLLVPFKEVARALGVRVAYDQKSKGILLNSEFGFMSMGVGDRLAILNGDQDIVLTDPPEIVGSTIYIPLEFVGEVFDASVNWSKAHRSASIVFPEVDVIKMA